MNKRLLLAICYLFLLPLSSNSQVVVNCAGSDSSLLFFLGGAGIEAYDPALPFSATNPYPFLTGFPPVAIAGLAVGNNLNGSPASPTFYTNSGGDYAYYNGAAWVNTAHTASAVNLGGGVNYIFNKNGGTGNIFRYDGTGNDILLSTVPPSSGPFDLAVDKCDNYYHLMISSIPGKLYKYDSTGSLIDSFSVTGCPSATAGGGFAIIGNKVYTSVGSTLYEGIISAGAVVMSAIGTLTASDFASCPSHCITAVILPPVANFIISDDSICEGSCIQFTDLSTNSPTTWSWTFPSAVPGTSNLQNPGNVCFNTQGIYTVQLIASNAVGSDTISKSVYVFPNVTASVSGDSLLCQGDSTTLTAAPSGLSYVWSTTELTQSITHAPNITTTYSVVVTQGICSDTANYVVQVVPKFQAYISGDTIICKGSSTILSALPLGLVYSWNTGSTSQNITVTPSEDTTYNILITQGPCTDSAYVSVQVIDTNYGFFTMPENEFCVGQPVKFFDSIFNANSFQWDFGDGSTLDNVHNPIHSYSSSSSPTFIITLSTFSIECGTTTFSLPVTINEYPLVSLGDDQSICPGISAPIILTNILGSLGINQWSTGDNSLNIVVTEPGHYWLNVINGKCETTDSIWIKRDCYINIPNTFSPNGDGLNDYFFPRDLLSSGLKSFTMNIFNRWGENIFTTNKIDGRGWDGKYNGVPQNVGVYVYILNAEFINNVKKTFTGNVTLLR